MGSCSYSLLRRDTHRLACRRAKLSLEDALAYTNKVKLEFASKPQVYEQFVHLIEQLRTQEYPIPPLNCHTHAHTAANANPRPRQRNAPTRPSTRTQSHERARTYKCARAHRRVARPHSLPSVRMVSS